MSRGVRIIHENRYLVIELSVLSLVTVEFVAQNPNLSQAGWDILASHDVNR